MARAFLFLSANTPWVYALARSLAAHGAVTALRFYDWANYRRLKPQWPEETSPVRRLMVKLPPGYAGRFEPIFRPYVRAIIMREWARLRRATGAEPITVCPYPYLAPWVRAVPDESLVYYNLDDYSLYDPARATRTALLEDELISRARLSICLSVNQMRLLQSCHPEAAGRIVHFPLGVVDDFLNPAPHIAPLPNTVGYIGNLSGRVDWRLIERVATLVPEARFHIIGKLDAVDDGPRTAGWQEARDRVLTIANVVYEGAVPQAEVREHYWRYAVNWMPYAMDHPFNIASCPTKIMDALASGRPFLSTDIPEVHLYPDRIHVVRTPEEAAERLRALLATCRSHDSEDQVAYAATQTWAHRAIELVTLVDGAGVIAASAASAAPAAGERYGNAIEMTKTGAG